MDSLVSRWFDPGGPLDCPHQRNASGRRACLQSMRVLSVRWALEPAPHIRRTRPATYRSRNSGLEDLEVVYSGAGRGIVSDLENITTRAGTAGGTFRAVLRR